MIIDAVYDFLCPWCHVGKRHLRLAMEAETERADAVAIELRWHQFMLYPEFDREGHDFLGFFRAKYGEALRVPMWEQIRAVAEPIGIRFAFEKMTHGPASLDGHRLVRWAEKQRPGIAADLIEDIARGFFEEARIIDNDFLVAIAAEHGLDPVAARAHLEGPEDIDALFAETDAWRARGVTSMPHYILHMPDGSEAVVRETSVATFAQLFDRARRVAA
jgi:predicted DsbA family dithiol-disulfide isomerase